MPRHPELSSNDATLTLVSDEGSECRLSSIYLVSCGLRVRFARDFLHRLNNTHNNAVSSAGYSDVQAKVIFLSRANRTPYGSAGAKNRKQEMFLQLQQLAKAETKILEEAQNRTCLIKIKCWQKVMKLCKLCWLCLLRLSTRQKGWLVSEIFFKKYYV